MDEASKMQKKSRRKYVIFALLLILLVIGVLGIVFIIKEDWKREGESNMVLIYCY